MKKLVILLSLIVSLSGCAVSRSIKAREAKKNLTGSTKEKILECMGAAVAKQKEGNIEVWLYRGDAATNSYRYLSGTARGRVSAFINSIRASGRYSGYGYSESRVQSCTINIVFKNNLVTSVNYSGDNYGLLIKNEKCASAVANC